MQWNARCSMWAWAFFRLNETTMNMSAMCAKNIAHRTPSWSCLSPFKMRLWIASNRNCWIKYMKISIARKQSSIVYHTRFLIASEYHEWSAGAHLRMLTPWATRLLSQWMLHWWQVRGSTAREVFRCTNPYQTRDRGYRFSSLRFDPTAIWTQATSVIGACSIPLGHLTGRRRVCPSNYLKFLAHN